MGEQITYRLGEIATFINGRAYAMNEMLQEGKYRIVRVGNFTGKDEWYYSDLELEEDKYCENGDLLYKWACTFGPEIWNEEKVIYHYHIWKVIPDENKIDKDYLFYLLKFMTSQWMKAAHGSTMIHITKEIMENNTVTIPADVSEQRKVASVLKSLDTKMTLNNSICADLEAMIKQLYDYWFVQFDFPNKDRKPYKSSGGKMLWSEELKREIPEGWEVCSLFEIANMVTESVFPDSCITYYHYSIPAYDDYKVPVNEKGEDIASNKYLVKNEYILVSKLNPHFKRIWNLYSVEDNAICSTEFMPFIGKRNSKEYLYSLLNSDAFYTFMINCSSSSTGSRKRMQPELCGDFKFAYPGDDIMHMYCQSVKDSMLQQEALLQENSELTALRDYLLPMLMNGQIKFEQTEGCLANGDVTNAMENAMKQVTLPI